MSYSPRIMGIVNVTPDSFSDGGQFASVDKAIDHGLRLIDEGADILDIGGESTRPGAVRISIDEEIKRVAPVIEGLVDKGVELSVDTRNSSTMRAALAAGADIINDVTALSWDEKSLDVAAQSRAKICLMHMQGEPQTMQANPVYGDVVSEVYDYLEGRIQVCVEAGIAKDRLMVDVGIGFGKTLDHNLALLRNLERFHALGVPVLLGASRKSFIGHICGEKAPADKRLAGSLAAVGQGASQGVQIFRVHDVFETRQFLDVYGAVGGGVDCVIR